MRSLVHLSGSLARADEVDQPRYTRVLVAVDSSAQALSAVRLVAAMTRSMPLDVALLHTVPPADPWDAVLPMLSLSLEGIHSHARATGAELLHRCRRLLPRTCHVEEMLTEGSASTHIVRAAEAWRADLIVIGVHGRDPSSSERLGNTTSFVIRRAPCAVMTVRSAGPATASTRRGHV